MITSHELGRAPLPSRPPWLSSRGLGQRNILDSPLAWSIQASDCIKLFDDFMVTETWSALADAFGGEEKITTADLVHYFVKPLTRATGSSLALLLNKDMETPHVAEGIVSHAWYGSAVETYLCLKTINLSAYVYFDPFTMYHNGEDHPNALSVSAQVQATPMEKIAASQPKYGMYLIHTSLYDVYERLWIIYELDVARVAGIVIRGLYDLDSFLKVDGLKKLTEKRVDVRAAKVVNGADRDLIERSINTHGGYDALHECIERVRRVMNECLLPKAAYVGHWTLVKAFVLEECDLDAKDYVSTSISMSDSSLLYSDD